MHRVKPTMLVSFYCLNIFIASNRELSRRQAGQERLAHTKSFLSKHPVLLIGSCGDTDSQDSSSVICYL